MMKQLLILIVCLNCLVAPAYSQETTVHAVALFNGRVMLSVNGGKAKIVKVGDTYKSVKVIAANTEQATIKLNGKTEVLRLNGTVFLSQKLGTKSSGSKKSIRLWADDDGFFRADGQVNDSSVEFLVDTGANLVVMSSRQADSIGLGYRSGQLGMAETASGRAQMFVVQLDQVSIQGLQLEDIEAGVVIGSFPKIPLLGMTFLDKLEMQRRGDVMTLSKSLP